FVGDIRQARTVPSAQLGDQLALLGRRLAGGSVSVAFRNQRVEGAFTPAQILSVADDAIIVSLPEPGDPNDPTSPMATWPAGFYTAVATVQHAGEPDRISNEIAFSLAPTITIAPTSAAAGDITLAVTCAPMVHPGQRVSLLFRDGEIAAPSPDVATNSLAF